MEIGIERGRFQALRISPEVNPPDGAFVIRIEDLATNIVVTTTLSTEEALNLANGLINAVKREQVASIEVVEAPNQGTAERLGLLNGGERSEAEEPVIE